MNKPRHANGRSSPPAYLMRRSAHVRIARATDNVPDVVRFYREGLWVLKCSARLKIIRASTA